MKRLALTYTGGGRNYTMPAGLIYLATWVKHHLNDWEVRIVDSNFEVPHQVLLSEHFDVYGITAMTAQYEEASKLAKILKVAGKGPIVLGGVHVTTAGPDTRKEFDVRLLGEGEQPLIEYLKFGAVTQGHQLPLKDYPDLDYGLLNTQYWKPRPVRVWHDTVVEGTLITSRGCPYTCRFCATSVFWQKYRVHDSDWVIRQLQALVEKGVTHVQIFDDLFGCHKKRLADIAERFEKAGLRKRIKAIACQSRANIIDDEMCDLLKSMNVDMVLFGFESGNDRVLKYLKKTGASVAQNKATIQLVARNKMRCVASMIFGSPSETAREMLDTVRFIAWGLFHGLYDIWVFPATPFPATEFWEEAKKRGLLHDIEQDWNTVRLRTYRAGTPLLSDVPHWKFRLVWYLNQIVMLPFKFIKAWHMLSAYFKR